MTGRTFNSREVIISLVGGTGDFGLSNVIKLCERQYYLTNPYQQNIFDQNPLSLSRGNIDKQMQKVEVTETLIFFV